MCRCVGGVWKLLNLDGINDSLSLMFVLASGFGLFPHFRYWEAATISALAQHVLKASHNLMFIDTIRLARV